MSSSRWNTGVLTMQGCSLCAPPVVLASCVATAATSEYFPWNLRSPSSCKVVLLQIHGEFDVTIADVLPLKLELVIRMYRGVSVPSTTWFLFRFVLSTI